MTAVVVYLVPGETRSGDSNLATLTTLFSDPYFQVETGDNASGTFSERTLDLLNRAAQDYPQLPVLLVRDSSTSLLTPQAMQQRVSAALAAAPGANLFLLCHWQEDCYRFRPVSNTTEPLVETVTPTATQAVLYRPTARDTVRSRLTPTTSLPTLFLTLITENLLSAVTFSPNLIDYDIGLATSTGDYLRLNRCRPLPASSRHVSWTGILWFVVMIAVLGVVAWALIEVGPRGESTLPG
jgi:hypothetical protein